MFNQCLATLNQAARKTLIALIKTYRYTLSPLLGHRCRFYPSCSCYAQEAIQHFGVIKGLVLTTWRLLRCHPFHPGGYDPLLKEKE